jgi:uncharacterized membrane protein
MRTHKYLGALLGLGLGIWLLSISACQQSATAPDQAAVVPELPQPEALPSAVIEATEHQDFALEPPRSDFRRAPLHIWRCLQLDSAQRVAVMACLKNYRDSVSAVLRTLRESERQYWQQARDMRRAVLDSLRQGLLDRQTAGQRLREIAQWLRQQLQENPVRAWAAQELERLKQALCECVAQVLTPEQQQIWQCWCSGGTQCCPNGDGGGKGDGGPTPPGGRRP